jgi:hypothetical protein
MLRAGGFDTIIYECPLKIKRTDNLAVDGVQHYRKAFLALIDLLDISAAVFY